MTFWHLQAFMATKHAPLLPLRSLISSCRRRCFRRRFSREISSCSVGNSDGAATALQCCTSLQHSTRRMRQGFTASKFHCIRFVYLIVKINNIHQNTSQPLQPNGRHQPSSAHFVGDALQRRVLPAVPCNSPKRNGVCPIPQWHFHPRGPGLVLSFEIRLAPLGPGMSARNVPCPRTLPCPRALANPDDQK